MRTRVTFTLPAPADAPEVKGPRMYFRPEWLEWSIAINYIGALHVTVTASGPATRTTRMRWDARVWLHDDPTRVDDPPDWIVVPHEHLAVAIASIEALGVCDE